MSGINLLKQVDKRDADVETQDSGSSGGGFGADLTVAEKIQLSLLLLGGVVFYFSTSYLTETYLPQRLAVPQAELAQVQNEMAQVKSKLKELDDLKKFIEQHNIDVEELKRRIRALIEIREGQRDRAVRMVDYIIGQMPDPIWIEDLQLEVKSGQPVTLKGYSRNYQTISTYFTQLEEGVYFKDWELINSELKAYTPSGEGAKSVTASYFELKSTSSEVPQ